jgi:hypothetical protein
MKSFWEIFIDDTSRTFEVLGSSTDDTLLTNNTVEMWRAGFKVRCQTPDISIPKEEIKIAGYKQVEKLYSRLIREYEELTTKSLRLW